MSYYDSYPNHEPDHHNGECIYCRGFSYDDAWWSKICEERVEAKRKQILDKPDVVRSRIARLEKELEEAEREAAKAKEQP